MQGLLEEKKTREAEGVLRRALRDLKWPHLVNDSHRSAGATMYLKPNTVHSTLVRRYSSRRLARHHGELVYSLRQGPRRKADQDVSLAVVNDASGPPWCWVCATYCCARETGGEDLL